MPAIDCTDCYLAIEIGDGVRRALIAHFNHFIDRLLAARGLTLESDAARDRRDQEAWRLSSRVLSEAKAELAGALDEALLVPDPQKSVQAILTEVVSTAAAASQQRYVEDDLLGFEAFITRLERLGAESSASLD